MLKTLIRSYSGQGQIVLTDREIEVDYKIDVKGNSNVRDATGFLSGISGPEQMELMTDHSLLNLRLHTGQIVEIALFGGPLGSPLRIGVNTPMPGLD